MKKPVVMKFGGAALASVNLIQNAALLIRERLKTNPVIVVVSAMGHQTDHLLELCESTGQVSSEIDTVLTAGEQVAAGLMTLALQSQGVPARSFLAHQIPVFTDGRAGDARILEVGTDAIERTLRLGQTPVVAGFQGIDAEYRMVTLGRGGSDKTAVAVAAAFEASSCEFYKDVSGIFTNDPHRDPFARKMEFVTYQQMLAMAQNGAEVLHEDAVVMAEALGIPLYVRSFSSNENGTWIGAETIDSKKEVFG